MSKEKISKEEESKAEDIFNEFKKEEYSEEDMNKVLDNEESIMFKMSNSAIEKFTENVKDFFSMLKAYFTGEYKQIPVVAIVSIIGTLLYVLSPVDVVPDFIPFAGYLDDATVLGLCVSAFGSAINDYKNWRDGKK